MSGEIEWMALSQWSEVSGQWDTAVVEIRNQWLVSQSVSQWSASGQSVSQSVVS